MLHLSYSVTKIILFFPHASVPQYHSLSHPCISAFLLYSICYFRQINKMLIKSSIPLISFMPCWLCENVSCEGDIPNPHPSKFCVCNHILRNCSDCAIFISSLSLNFSFKLFFFKHILVLLCHITFYLHYSGACLDKCFLPVTINIFCCYFFVSLLSYNILYSCSPRGSTLLSNLFTE